MVQGRKTAATASLAEKSATLFGLAIPGHVSAIEAFVQDQLTERRTRLKEVTYLQDGCFGVWNDRISPPKVVEVRTVGWFDIENHWLLTRDSVLLDGFGHMLQINA